MGGRKVGMMDGEKKGEGEVEDIYGRKTEWGWQTERRAQWKRDPSGGSQPLWEDLPAHADPLPV